MIFFLSQLTFELKHVTIDTYNKVFNMFNKNLESINNPALKRRLEKINPADAKQGITYLITPSNDYILLKDDVPLDDLNNPREAIKHNLKINIKEEMRPNDIIVVFGLGLGYLLDEVFTTYPSRIFVYEPDLNLMHFVLSNVDISEHLSSGRVYITNDLDELIKKLETTYISKDKLEIVYLQNYAIVRNKELLIMTQRAFEACKSKLVDVNTIAKFSERWLVNTMNNISSVNNGEAYLLSDLENKFIGQTAMILGAGPSLADNIQRIKMHRSRFVIFAVNKVVKYLEQNNIIPDFVVCLDAGNMDRTIEANPHYLSQINCIVDMRADKTLFAKPFKKIFVNFSDTDFIVTKLAKSNPFMKIYESGGTSTIMALVAAAKLGFSKIVLAGIDLAFKDSMVYADGETMNRVSQEEIIVDKVKQNLVQVKSVTGATVYTREDYQAFIHQFGEVIKLLGNPNVYSLTTFGAEIKGVRAVNFESLSLMVAADVQILSTLKPFKFNTETFVQDEFLNINNIIAVLSKEVFSPELVSAIVKSVLIYQYVQSDILTVLQSNFDPLLAENFINKTKQAIKVVVDILQNNKLI